MSVVRSKNSRKDRAGPDPEELQRRNQALCLMDDIFMRACFQHSSDCVERILRVILEKNLKVRTVELQKTLSNLPNLRSIVMDIFAEDSEGKLYNIEMQTGLPGASPRRPRFYLSMMDVNVLKAGEDFERLPEAYSIFIVEGDPFGTGEPLYMFTRRTKSGLSLGDGTTIIYMNAQMQDPDTELGHLAHDLHCTNPDAMWFSELAKAAWHFKRTPEGVRRMNNMMAELWEEGWEKGQLEGWEKGISLGREEGKSTEKRDSAARMLAMGKFSMEDIAAGTDLSLDEVRALAEQQREM
ncbi:MAG: Rpn family recombination-promoting nuclease/putative transposase [bacterium]|nr:Rpn family recombination-promoting nuclease/putative transposase [bacterium]